MQKKIFLTLTLIGISYLCLLSSFAQDNGYHCEQAKSTDVKRLAIRMFDKSGRLRHYGVGALLETITDDIISNVLNDSSATEFFEIISRDQLELVMSEQNLSFTGQFDAQTVAGIGAVVGVHELVIGQITQIIYTSARPKQDTWDRQATIRKKTGTESYVDNEGNIKTRDKYSDVRVSARVTRTQIESSFSIIGSYIIVDVKTAMIKKAHDFTTKHEFSAEWARFTGDEEALTRFDRALTSRPEEHAPVEAEMALETANQLAIYLAETLKTYMIESSSVPTLKIALSSVVSPVVGENLIIKVDISGVENVAGYQTTVSYDNTALRYIKSANGDYLPVGAFFVPPVVEENKVTLAATSLTGERGGDGTLATITFEVVAVKPSTVHLSNALLTDRSGVSSRPCVGALQITVPLQPSEDINRDGIVNIIDLTLVASNFGKTGANAADVNGDGIINIVDLTLVAAAFGNTAGAPALWSRHLEGVPTRADLEAWLHEAKQMNLTDPAFQRGLLMLEYLLAALTPKETTLLPNYPNPFNPETWIPYQLAEPADVTISIYSTDGRLVRILDLGHQSVGLYESRSRAAYWDGRNAQGEPVASGVYFYTLTAGDFTATRKLLIRK